MINIKYHVKLLIINLFLVLSFLTPGSRSEILIVSLLIATFLYGNFSKYFLLKFILVFSLLFSVLLNIQDFSDYKELVRTFVFVVGFAFFPFRIGISDISKSILWSLFLFLIVIQIGIGLGIPEIIELREYMHPNPNTAHNQYDGHLDSLESLAWRRFGGYYYNYNNLGQYYVFLFVLFIMKFKLQSKDRQNSLIILFLFFFPFTLITGSRISLFTILMLFGFCLNHKRKIFVMLSLFLFSILSTSFNGLFSARGFQIGTGVTKSIWGKIDLLTPYIATLSNDIWGIVPFLFGTIGEDINTEGTAFDADLGYILYAFGLVGTLLMIIYYAFIFYSLNRKFRFIYLLFLFSISMTVIFKFTIFILFTIILSISYNESKSIFHV